MGDVILDDMSASGVKTSASEEQEVMENGRQEDKAAQKERNYFQMIEVRTEWAGVRSGGEGLETEFARQSIDQIHAPHLPPPTHTYHRSS